MRGRCSTTALLAESLSVNVYLTSLHLDSASLGLPAARDLARLITSCTSLLHLSAKSAPLPPPIDCWPWRDAAGVAGGVRHNHLGGGTGLLGQAVEGGCRLASLDLADNSINDSALQPLTAALANPNCSLVALDLGWNLISDDGAAGLVRVLRDQNCVVQALALHMNAVSTSTLHKLDLLTSPEGLPPPPLLLLLPCLPCFPRGAACA